MSARASWDHFGSQFAPKSALGALGYRSVVPLCDLLGGRGGPKGAFLEIPKIRDAFATSFTIVYIYSSAIKCICCIVETYIYNHIIYIHFGSSEHASTKKSNPPPHNQSIYYIRYNNNIHCRQLQSSLMGHEVG